MLFFQAPDEELVHGKKSTYREISFSFFELKGYYISVDGHGLFIGMEAKCFLSDCFTELSQYLDC